MRIFSQKRYASHYFLLYLFVYNDILYRFNAIYLTTPSARMKTKIGIGHSNQTDSFLAGKEAASRAVKHGNIDRADFALIFCGGKHNPKQFLNGVNQVIPDCEKAGGTSFGVISDTFIGYDGFEVGVT